MRRPDSISANCQASLKVILDTYHNGLAMPENSKRLS